MIRKFRYRPGEKGNAIVELALTLPILLLVIFGVIHFGRAVMTTNILYTAAREGARSAAVALPGDSATVYSRVNQVLLAGRVRNGHTAIAYDLPNKSVSVTITSQFSVIGRRIPILGGGAVLPDSIPLSATAIMKYER